MKSFSSLPMCLADNGSDLVTYEHDDRVLDPCLHYFGCLKASQRDEYFTRLPQPSQRKIVEERRRITTLRAFVEAHPNSHAGAIFKDFKHGAKVWYHHDRNLEVEEEKHSPRNVGPHTFLDEEINARVIFFNNGRPHTIPKLDDRFPCQKVSIKQLLADDPVENPLMQPCESGTLRYFHLPANNMVWVEVTPQRFSITQTLMIENRKLSHVIIMSKGPMTRIVFRIQTSNKGLNTRCSFGRSRG